MSKSNLVQKVITNKKGNKQTVWVKVDGDDEQVGKKKINLSLVSGYHVTGTEKAHITQMLEMGIKQGGTKRKHYEITKLKNDQIKVVIKTKSSDDWGKPRIDKQTVTLKVK